MLSASKTGAILCLANRDRAIYVAQECGKGGAAKPLLPPEVAVSPGLQHTKFRRAIPQPKRRSLPEHPDIAR